MFVNHANENEIYILYFISLKIVDYRFLYSYRSQASIQSIKIFTLQHEPGNPKKGVQKCL